MKKTIIVALLMAGFAFVACNKDDNDNPQVTTIDLLASGTWKIDTIGFDGNKDGVIDEAIPAGVFEECDLDNTLTFNKDSVSGIFDEGALKCDPADPQTIDFTYQLKGDTVINFSGNLPDELKGDVTIQTLTNTQFIMSKRIVLSFPPIDKNLIIALTK